MSNEELAVVMYLAMVVGGLCVAIGYWYFEIYKKR
jgi:hypothetical protein